MLSQLNFIVLSENRVVSPNLTAEQGLSILIETSEGNILFDTGQTDAFLRNANQLNINLSNISKVFLSHGHYDHTGGLRALLRIKSTFEVFCHPNLFNKKFNVIGTERLDIGVQWEKSDLEHKGVKFILKTQPKEILPGIWISGEIPRLTEYEFIAETYQEQVLESFIHDEIHDDMSLIFKTEKGLIVLLGCGHAGPINTIKHAMRIVGENRLHAVIGGMHLHRAPQEKIKKIVDNMIHLDPDHIIPLHCCGFRTINCLFSHFKERVHLYNVGDSFILS
jgi:7,8-dihydropterin-6-yl-methyl-4-(beta-D-ribofuranosyl)aminobenzene 5'-phosphate synthase